MKEDESAKRKVARFIFFFLKVLLSRSFMALEVRDLLGIFYGCFFSFNLIYIIFLIHRFHRFCK